MIKTIYNTQTGQIVSVSKRPDNFVLPEGFATIEGKYNSTTQYVDQNQQVQNLPLPPDDSGNYEFNWTEWRYDLKNEPVNEGTERNRRTGLLGAIDRISATRYASLSPAQQQELQTYRQALLDVPQQAGFPTNITWPTKPDWL